MNKIVTLIYFYTLVLTIPSPIASEMISLINLRALLRMFANHIVLNLWDAPFLPTTSTQRHVLSLRETLMSTLTHVKLLAGQTVRPMGIVTTLETRAR